MRIALYNPGWHIMGGGEKYLGTIAEVLSEHHDVDLLAVRPVDLAQLQERLGLRLDRVGLVEIPCEATSCPESVREWLRNRCALRRRDRELRRVTRAYDLAIAGESDRPPPLAARWNVLHIQVPHRRWRGEDFLRALGVHRVKHPGASSNARGSLAEIRRELVRLMTFRRALRRFDLILYNSHFTARVVEENWHPGVPSLVLSPPVDLPSEPIPWDEKENLILSVGRFFRGGHEKHQHIVLEAFRLLSARRRGWELHLVGGADQTSDALLEELRARSRDLPVVFHVNASRSEVHRLYRRGRAFWLATGYGADERREPERVEHFGIAVVEAMGYGCIPFAIGRGGPREIIEPGVSGFFWETIEELVEKTLRVMEREDVARLSAQARERAREFGCDRFRHRVLEALAHLLSHGRAEDVP